MKMTLVTLILLVSGTAFSGDYLRYYADYPIVTAAQGAGGTNWLTEFNITNPQSHAIVVRIYLTQNGEIDEWTLTIPAGETFSWSDFLGDGLGRSGNAAPPLRADEDDNPGYDTDCLEFASSVKIYNSGGGSGTFGQEIPSSDSLSGSVGSYVAYFTGVKNYGSAGVSGYRTNIGFWHAGYSMEQLRLRIYDADGAIAWQSTVTVHPDTATIISVPTTVTSGALVVNPLGEYVDCVVYISVVDNQTGDGAYRALKKADPDDLAACGVTMTKSLNSSPFDEPKTEEEATARRYQLLNK